jgi:hypothetical protein
VVMPGSYRLHSLQRWILTERSHVIAGNIIAKLGIKYLYIISFAVMTPFLITIYFVVWETTYFRPPPEVRNMQVNEPDSPSSPDDIKKGSSISHIETVRTSDSASSLSTGPVGEPTPYKPPTEAESSDAKWTFAQNVRLYRGRVSNRSFFKALWQPFPFMIFPSVLFSTVVNGAYITWSMMAGIISHQVLLYPPYNLQPDTLAYISLPGSFVGLAFSIMAGLSSDKLIQWMAHRNNGLYEPEYRLLLMLPAVIFSTMGFLILGPLYRDHAPVWKLVVTGLLFHVSGPFASSSTVTYIFDTMQHQSTEAFVATSLFKHIFIFLVTTYVPGWFAKVGAMRAFTTLAILNLAFAFLTIPMYIYGKRMRGWVSFRILDRVTNANGSRSREVNFCEGRLPWAKVKLSGRLDCCKQGSQ